MSKFTIGIDFGTLSARAVLVDVDNGVCVASSVCEYPHKILTEKEIYGGESKVTTALQHPDDYIFALKETVRGVMKEAKVDPKDVLGLGIDFTSCTVLPVKKDFTPLCEIEKFKNNIHAYVKLWKHHGANEEADLMTEKAYETGEKWIECYGKKVSSEWCLPKVLETLNNAKEVFDDADYFVEAGDYLTWKLTDNIARSSCMAGFKAQWDKKVGYPSKKFLTAVDKRLENIFETKLSGDVISIGSSVGKLGEFGQELLGLDKDTVVATAVIDAHSALVSSGVTGEGELLMILGTSACHILLSKKDENVAGICGKVMDGVVPDFYAYEAGQVCFGDTFDWFVNNLVPEEYFAKAKEKGQNVFDYFNGLCKDRKVGESGLIAIDWLNGNRTPYADYDLSGMIIGLSHKTRSEDIYEALVFSCAYGTKKIVSLYENSNVKINKVVATGGIALKNEYLMQVLSDVLGREILVAKSKQAGAKGASIYAATACGYYKDLENASKVMGDKEFIKYTPNREKTEKHEKAYLEYEKISEYFALQSDVMKRIKKI